MAGRRITSIAARATAATLVALAVGTTIPATAAPADGPIVVSRPEGFSSVPFGYRTETGRAQKLAQTFKAPEGAHKLASVSLPLSGAAKAVVKVYEVGERPPFGTLLKEMVVTVGDASGEPASGWVRLPVRPAVAMKPGHRYSLVLKTDRKRDQLWTSHANDRYRGGQSWCFCPVWKNQEIDFDTLRWQSAEDLDRPTDDLAFELRFWRKG